MGESLPHRAALVVAEFALRTERGVLRPLWRALYGGVARVAGLALTAGLGRASVYVGRSVAARDAVYGVSDIDLAVVTERAEAVRVRREGLRRRLPLLARALPDLTVYSPAELGAAAGASTVAHTGDALYLGSRHTSDELGLRERPGLGGPASDWRRVSGREVLPRVARPERGALAVAAWLELQFWWAQAIGAAAREDDRLSGHLCFKLVAEPARIVLALEHGVVERDRVRALGLALERLPEEEAALRAALALRARLAGDPPWDLALDALVRLSDRVARGVWLAGEGAGTGVLLTGARDEVLDWRGLVLPGPVDDRFARGDGNPASRADLAAAVARTPAGAYELLSTEDTLVLAAGEPWTRSLLRAAHCRATAPALFALAAGGDVAAFPGLPGLSAGDVAARAVAEHRGWLAAPSPGLSERAWLDGREAGLRADERVRGRLLAAARAALFAESIERGDPELVVGRGELVSRLGLSDSRRPELHAAVAALPAYAGRIPTARAA